MTKEQALQMRRLMELGTESLSDEQALEVSTFVERWEAGKDYEVDKRVSVEENGVIVLYKCLQAHTSQSTWNPKDAPSLWAKILIPDPEVIPEWEQPDSTNPYMTGDKVTHNNKTWVSDVDNNVWEPGVYGWTEVA